MKAGFFENIIKGIVIGVANIAPGVSGSALSISMGVYDRILEAIVGLFHETGRAIKILAPFAIGMAIGVFGLSFLFEALFSQWPFQMNAFFLGLVGGCIPAVWEETKKYSFRLSYLPVFLFFFVMVMLPIFTGKVNGRDVVFSPNLLIFGKLFLVGMIAAATLIIPGISGTLLLAVMGYYLPILRLINRTLEAMAGLDIPLLFSQLIYLLPFSAGVLAGGFWIARLMRLLLKNLTGVTYWGIWGIVLASPVAMLFSLRAFEASPATMISGFAFLCVGAFFANRLSEKTKSPADKTAEDS